MNFVALFDLPNGRELAEKLVSALVDLQAVVGRGFDHAFEEAGGQPIGLAFLTANGEQVGPEAYAAPLFAQLQAAREAIAAVLEATGQSEGEPLGTVVVEPPSGPKLYLVPRKPETLN